MRPSGKCEERKTGKKLGDAYSEGRERLKAAGVPEPDLDAWYLLESVTGVSRALYYARPGQEMTESQSAAYESCIRKRCARIPLQHITGVQEFMGLEFRVSGDVLIPRQDTEVLVEEALKAAGSGAVPTENGTLRVLDLCTGSGCILLSFLYWLKKNGRSGGKMPVGGIGSDLSERALGMAKENAGKLKIPAEFVQGDLFENVRGSFGLILSNPPYIRTAELDSLQDEVRLYDPREALDGKEDGLYFYRRIVRECRPYLADGGYLMFEIGCDQAEDVADLMRKGGFLDIEVKKDLAGLDRVVFGRYS